MNGEARKLLLIQELLKISDETVLAEVESLLSKGKLHVAHKKSFKDFAGKISGEELIQMEKIIEQGCEQINTDDWK
jgi:hypothetical protein